MIKTALLAAFFLTVVLDEMLDIGLVAVVGLSAKNAFLYILLLAILCGKVADRGDGRVQFAAIHLLFIVLIVNAALSIFYMHFVSGQTAGFSLFGHIGLLKSSLLDMYLMFLVFFYGVDTRQAAVGFAKLLLLVISLMGLITLMDVLKLPDMGLVGRGPYGRLEGPLGQANSYGVFLAFFIPMLVLAATGLGNRLSRLGYLLGAAVSFALLIQTGSRGALIGMLGGVLLTAWWLRGGYDPRKAARAGAAILVFAVILLAVVLLTSEEVGDIVRQRIERSTAGSVDQLSSGRMWIWTQGLNYLMARPWAFMVGIGWGTFWDKIGIGPHSAYVNYLFSLGIIGLGLFLALVWQLLATARRAYFSAHNSAEERLLIAGLIMGWFVLVIAMLTGSIFKPWMFIWPFTGVCFRIAYCLLGAPARQPEPGKPADAVTGSGSGIVGQPGRFNV
ncbi:MAG: O-antigen ligase family protein [Aquisalimonadaceae bacterium]